MHLAGLGHNYGRMRTKEWKWDDIAKRMANAGRPKDVDDCMKKWDNLFQNYKKIERFQNANGQADFFRISNEERKEHNFKFRMESVLYNEIHAGMLGNHTIFPPNVADTGSPDGVQLPRQGAVGGEFVGSEAGGDGCPEECSAARDSDNNPGSGAGGGKRKYVRQQALESIVDVMDRHGELMSTTIDSSSKRQCSIFTRQCDKLEQEVAVQKAHYAASDETQRMMCHTLMEIAATIRGRSSTVAEDHRRRLCSHLVTWRIFAGVVVLLSYTWTSTVNHSIAEHSHRRSSVLLAVNLFAAERSRRALRPSVVHVYVVVYVPRRRNLLRRGGIRPRQAAATRETFFSPDRWDFKRRSTKRFPLIRSDHQARLKRSRRSMSTRGSARGKKRDSVPDDTQGQRRGRRHVPKAKRARLDDASASMPPRRAQGWAAAAEGDYDDSSTREEEQAEATASVVRESAWQRSPDQTPSKRMLTPPPEAQQLRASDTQTEKVVVVDLGGDDDEPLEKNRLRTIAQGIPTSAATSRAAVDERRLLVGGESAGAAGAGASGAVAPIATAREEAPVVVTAREEAHGENKIDRDGGEAGSNRVRRGVMTKDLVDRVVLWVDDKAFGTTGEGQRLYNIVHETREYFVAIVSGLPTPVVPRSVVLPKSSTKVARITDPSQLQQAISRAAAVENIALRILHGWIFKSGNRPRGYNVAFQYSLESAATDIARAMWYGEEWCNVVSAVVCAHTIDLSMDLPLWFAGANIEDRPKDDDMAAYQEFTVICVAHAFHGAVQMGAHIDGDFISYDRLCRVADCFRLLLAACMWIMSMAGDDPRSHYEAFYFADLVAKPTLVTSMHRSFDHRRFVVRATKVVTERLGKAKATFGEYKDYIPGWAPCDIGFRHDASIMGQEDAKKLDWLGQVCLVCPSLESTTS
ncbi:hypothetical protein CBR_g45747 [Chara braunii]|uniref:Myb/SANT-like DNA-binding domain-containing protein n=1 Tax=Chara braunii TaxID=69332 RepID=A0A388LZ99_CHABU|nr:hypothetical protein CBR_g45747 [Chara braunii]|eukprot:GBG87595.1 hypothetical protein CBR_g45747 [Chara braunii]